VNISARVSFACLLLVVVSVAEVTTVSVAQEVGIGVATGLSVNEDALEDGDILCTSGDGIKKCSGSYNSDIFGVYAVNPAVNFDTSENVSSSRPIIRDGYVMVRVSAVNGAVKVGDYITSSATAGVGQKADKSGNVLGTALAEYSSDDRDEVGLVRVAVGIRPVIIATSARGNLVEVLRQGFLAPTLTPLASLRYLLAILIALASLILGFIYFGKTANSGVESIGRNPMAVRVITFGMILNMAFTVMVVVGGLLLAYMVLII